MESNNNYKIKTTFLNQTNLPEDIIDLIIKKKNKLEFKSEVHQFFEDIIEKRFKPKFFFVEMISLHDFLIHIQNFLDKDLFKDIYFNIDLKYVDSCDYYNYDENDDFFHRKTYTIDKMMSFLNLKFNYVFLERLFVRRTLISKYDESKYYLTINIKLVDPLYQRVHIKKHKTMKKVKKWFWNLKQFWYNRQRFVL